MDPPPPRRRSVYADRLREFGTFAFGDDEAFARRGLWRDYFGPRIGPTFDGKLIVEIGCSDGGLIGQLATRHPTTAFVGVDWKAKALFQAAERVQGSALHNVALVRGRGQDVAQVFGEGEVDEVLLFHPDPCAGEGELKHRLVAEPFLLEVHRVLKGEGAMLTVKTDHPGYYQWMLALFGLPEASHFAQARERRQPGAPRHATDGPRVRPRDLMRTEDLLPPSRALMDRWEVSATSADFWHDEPVLRHTAHRCFSGEQTSYEQRFVSKRFPIYYFELTKR